MAMTEQLYGIAALVGDIEKPLKTYQQSLRRAWRTATDSPENDAAREQGAAALLEIEHIVRAWVAARPSPTA